VRTWEVFWTSLTATIFLLLTFSNRWPANRYWGLSGFKAVLGIRDILGGSGSPDLFLWLIDPALDPDPTPDPTSFFNDFKDVKKIIFFHIFFFL
jgi:hypothetical protein